MPASGNARAASTEMPASFGRARARRDDDAVGPRRDEIGDGRAVVAHDVDLRTQLPQVLDEVVGERVVVVDDEDAHGVKA